MAKLETEEGMTLEVYEDAPEMVERHVKGRQDFIDQDVEDDEDEEDVDDAAEHA